VCMQRWQAYPRMRLLRANLASLSSLQVCKAIREHIL